MTSVESSQPCAVESTLWRECLKGFDYGPDRPRGACEMQRVQYYTCIKQWRERTAASGVSGSQRHPNAAPAKVCTYKDFEMIPSCGHEAEKLHQCMMMNAFEVSRCQREMTLLKRCAAANDKEVMKYLRGDPAIADFENNIDNSTGLRRLWNKAIGKL